MSKLGQIEKFRDGGNSANRKLNDVVYTVNYLMRRGQVETPFIAGGGAGGGVTIEWYKVIESPLYEDPTTYALEGGRAYYTMRPVTTELSAWASGTRYLKDAIVAYPTVDSPCYKALLGKASPDAENNTNKNPVTETTYWEKQDEIKVEYAMGNDGEGIDIRHFIPWFKIGAVVPVISRIIPEIGIRYYIWAALTYGGTDSYASLRWNQVEGRAMACYK